MVVGQLKASGSGFTGYMDEVINTCYNSLVDLLFRDCFIRKVQSNL